MSETNAVPYVVALTGGIASGKTAVSDRFQALGVPVVDTDIIAREVVAPGEPLLARIVEHFGADICLADGSLDRRALRERIFADSQQRQFLEALLHPAIRAAALEKIRATSADFVILVIPLLTETGRWPEIDRVLVVDTDETTQLERLVRRDSVDRETAQAMLNAQASRDQRLAMADDVIVNSGTETELDEAVQALAIRYQALAGRCV